MSSPVPTKSQPLHNFSLPLLQWPKSQTSNHHRGRRLAGSSPPPPPQTDSSMRRHHSPLLDSAAWRQSPMRDSASESESCYAFENRKVSDHLIEKPEKKSASPDGDGGNGVKEVKSKICIRFRTKNRPDEVQTEGKTVNNSMEGGEVEESVAKSWNLRPRKPIRKQANVASFQGNKGLEKPTSDLMFSVRPEAVEVVDKEEMKQKFSVLLSRQEIEEDIFAMTGSKPARRPKKRAKHVQKQLDNVFPGLWLASITPDSYRVYEAPAKG